MAPGQNTSGDRMNDTARAFTELVNTDRTRKKHEQLAQQLLGSRRRSSGAGALPTRRTTPLNTANSLASRIGVTKRTAPPVPRRGNVDGLWGHDLHQVHNPTRNPPHDNRLRTDERAEEPAAKVSSGPGASHSIRGMAANGPFVVVASNFTSGTTAADIRAAMQPFGGSISSCELLTASPTVMAEIVFDKKEGAENVVATFNNQRADGRMLYVYLKQGGVTPGLHHFQNAQAGKNPRPEALRQRTGPQASDQNALNDDMDVDDGTTVNKQNDRDRSNQYQNQRARNLQDGRHGARGDARAQLPRAQGRANERYRNSR